MYVHLILLLTLKKKAPMHEETTLSSAALLEVNSFDHRCWTIILFFFFFELAPRCKFCVEPNRSNHKQSAKVLFLKFYQSTEQLQVACGLQLAAPHWIPEPDQNQSQKREGQRKPLCNLIYQQNEREGKIHRSLLSSLFCLVHFCR